ncbi:hypothetical protein HanRHA438_Chr03g0136431 [Helianthus annuus]|nr:hypothetical protein HanRHA438_Chr03g0136431 [Helianthus annuus]
MRRASSAKRRWVKKGPLLGHENPLKIPHSVAFLNMQANPSIPMIKRKGESRSPCLTPFWKSNSKVGEPLTRTEDLTEVKTPLIQHLHFSGKFICSMIDKI